MIVISDSARDRLLHIMQNENSDNEFVRVGVESGGCSGLSYKLEFDSSKNEDDELIKDNQIQLLVNKKSYLYLIGTILDYSVEGKENESDFEKTKEEIIQTILFSSKNSKIPFTVFKITGLGKSSLIKKASLDFQSL